MTHWYREPKRVKLMEHLERAGIDFVLSSDGFAESDLLKLKAVVSTALAERLTLGITAAGRTPRKFWSLLRKVIRIRTGCEIWSRGQASWSCRLTHRTENMLFKISSSSIGPSGTQTCQYGNRSSLYP